MSLRESTVLFTQTVYNSGFWLISGNNEMIKDNSESPFDCYI